jgi:hypothetical protein
LPVFCGRLPHKARRLPTCLSPCDAPKGETRYMVRTNRHALCRVDPDGLSRWIGDLSPRLCRTLSSLSCPCSLGQDVTARSGPLGEAPKAPGLTVYLIDFSIRITKTTKKRRASPPISGETRTHHLAAGDWFAKALCKIFDKKGNRPGNVPAGSSAIRALSRPERPSPW